MAYPNIASKSNTTWAGVSANVTLPAGIAVGDLLVLGIFSRSTSVDVPSGWTSVTNYTESATNTLRTMVRIADGTEGASVAVTTGGGGCIALCARYDGAGGVFDASLVEGTSAGSGGVMTSVNPPALTPSWGAMDASWLVFGGGGLYNYEATTWPYPNDQYGAGISGAYGCYVAYCSQDQNVASADPGIYAWWGGTAKSSPVAATLAIPFSRDRRFTPASFGSEAGFQAGLSFTIPSDVTIYPARVGLEVGFQAGLRIDVPTKRQVPLVGSGLEMPDRTEGGTEGQVLTQHEYSKPTWENPPATGVAVAESDGAPDVSAVTRIEFTGATVTDDTGGQVTVTIATPASALDDLSDVNAAAPSDTQVLTWDATPGEWIAADALAGADGADGSTWFAQSAEPVALRAGDLWLDTDDGEVYEWSGAAWVSVGNIMGAAGTNGTDGADGSTWFAQSAAPAANQTGDLWLDTDNGDVSQWDGASWNVVDNIMGPAGADGADGASLATDVLWAAAGDIVVATGNDAAAVLSVGSEGDVLTVVSGVPAWDAPAAGGDITTDPAWAAAGDLIVATGNNAASVLSVGSEGDVLTVASGVPAWEAPTGGAVPPALRVYLYSTFK